MKCSKCKKDNSPGAAYCFWCGGPLSHEVEIPRQPVSQVDELQEMRHRLRQMSLRLSTLEGQVKAIGKRMALEETEALPEPAIPEVEPSQPEARLGVEPITQGTAPVRWPGARPEKSQVTPGPTEPISVQPHREPEHGKRPQPGLELPRGVKWFEEWEQALPGNWLSRIGIVALFIGLGFLAKLVYDEGWIKPVVQLLIGLIIGAMLLWGGQHWNRRYRVWAQTLTGGGVAVLYLSVFASYALHDLMPFFPTFVLMFLITVGAVAIALRQDSMAIATIGIAGAFLVPVVLGASDSSDSSTGGDGHGPGLLIAYILLLDAGIVWLASLRNWRWFTLLGLAGSLLVYGLWYAESGHEESLAMTQGAFTGIFLAFVGATMLFHLAWRRVPEATDLALMSLNAAAYFGGSYLMMWDDYRGWLGTFSFLLAGFYGLLAYLALWRSDANRRLCHFAAGIAIVFLTIAIPMQFHRAWITVAWAAEGAVLTWIAARQSIPRLQVWALGAFGLVFVRLFAFDNAVDQASFRPVLEDDRFLPFAVSIAAFYAAAFFMRRDPKVLQPWFFPMMVLVGSFLTVWLLSADIVDFVGRRIVEARLDHSSGLHIRNLESARALALAMTWTVYGLCLMGVGVWRKWGWLRVGGYVLVAAAVGLTVVLLNHLYAGIHRASSTPILNYGFGGFAVSVLGLYLLAYIIARNRARLHSAETAMFPVLVTAGNVLSVWAMSAEVITFLSHMENTRSLALVSLWTAYGLCLMVVGVWKRWDWLRVGGYVLVAAAVGTTAVLLNHTSAEISRTDSTPILNYGFGGFAVCTCGLYLLAHIIARNRASLHHVERQIFPVLIVAANVLSLWAMSAEVITFLGDGGVENTRSLTLVSLWSAYGFCLVLVGIWRNWNWLRIGGYALAVIAAGMTLILLNHGHAEIRPGTSMPVLNYSFGGFAVCVIAFYLLAFVMAGNMSKLHHTEQGILPLLLVAANVLSLWAMSAEVLTYVTSGYGKSMGLTLLWAAYASAAVVVGIVGKWRWVRVGGLSLLAVAIVKLFIVDTFTLQSGYRVAAYLTLGVLLLAGGFVYHRYAEVIKGFILDEPGAKGGSGLDGSHGEAP